MPSVRSQYTPAFKNVVRQPRVVMSRGFSDSAMMAMLLKDHTDTERKRNEAAYKYKRLINEFKRKTTLQT